MSHKRSFRKVLKDWKETLSDVDGIKPNLEPFWKTQLGKGIRRLTSTEPSSKVDGRDDNTTWYAGVNTNNERALNLDNAFFEKITELDWKKQSLKPQSQAIKNLPSTIDETDEYSGDDEEVKQAAKLPQKSQSKTQSDKEECTELYSELLFVTINQFVSEQQRKDAPLQGEIYVYGQEVFGITQDKHRELFARVKERRPPTCHVEVKVIEARNIEAKDANGFSDPYCMLGVVTDHSFDRKVRRKTSKTKTVSEQLEEDLIKVTSVKKKTLNPVWNETLLLKVNDVLTETLHLDMWDEDEDSAFLDKDNKITQVRGVAGVGRFLKQVVQSSRKCSGSASMDDFLGFIEFPIKDIPSSGVDQWFPLQARSAKSRTSGDCHLVIRLVGYQNKNDKEDPGKSKTSRTDTYSTLLKAFLVYDGDNTENLDDVSTSGQLSRFARWILHQYVIQNNITLLQRAVCDWEIYSLYHQTQPLKYSFLEELLSSVAYNWKTGGLTLVDEETFHQSLDAFVEYCLRLISDHRSLYPATDSAKLSRLANMLNCIKAIQNIPNYCASRKNNISDEISNAVKISAERWYGVQYAWFEPQDPSQTSAMLSLVSLSDMIVSDLFKALKFYNKIFKEVGVDYFSLTYLPLEKLLASDMCQSVDKMDPVTVEVEVGEGDLGTKLFSLYLAAKEVMEYRQYLPLSEKTEFAFDSCHVWFKKYVEHWFKVAHQKALARITKAVEIDQAMVVDSSVKYSTSAVDVTCCFYQLCQFWKRLRWPDATESYLFVMKLTCDICEAACFYADELERKLKKNNYYDDNPSYFGVSESLCITLNNLAYTQQWLNELETHLDWDSIISDMSLAHNEREAKQFEETLRQLSENAQDGLLTKIDDMIYHIGEKMSVDIKRFVRELVNQNENVDISQAIEPLLSYLEKSLRVFYSTLFRPVFDRTLLYLWSMLVSNLAETVAGDKGKPPIFYQRLSQVVDVLIDFFCVDGIGLPLDKMMTDAVKALLEELLLRKLSTESLIEEYYVEKMKAMSLADAESFGELALRMFYDLKNAKLHVELLNGRNLPPLDSNGYCDPYVRLTLAPRHLFPSGRVERTEVQKKTLFPLFDAKFQFSVTAEACKQPGAHLQMTVLDYDVITDDMGGQVFATLNYVPGLDTEIPATFSGIEQVLLPIIHPTPDGKHFEILKARSDEKAVKFVKERQELYNKLLLVRDKIVKRT